jgi:cyclophilin family peptidyl-prolyl cis-trans isomerase
MNLHTKCKVKIQTTLFHRVIKDFMIQGGYPDSKGAPAGKMLGVGEYT